MNGEHYGELLAHRHALELAINHYETLSKEYSKILDNLYAEKKDIDYKISNHERRLTIKGEKDV